LEKEKMKIEISKILNKIGALKFGAFKLTSGKMSPYYMDLRIVPSFPDGFRRICEFYIELIRNDVGVDGFDRIAGIPTAGITIASIVAYYLKKPFLYVRRAERQHGRGRRVEGILLPGDRILLIDDLITKGGSILKSAESIRAEGGIINDAVVLMDREENGKQNLAMGGITLHYLITTTELAQNLHYMVAITDHQLETIMKRAKKK
jgi:orotate phosphoribosyltransferase